MLTVSRSVDRVFQIMELFSAKRRPLSATEIRLALEMPHSSTVSVLCRLVALGYLEQNRETKRFFPSLRLNRLCESVPEAIIGGNPLAALVDSLQAKLDETVSINRLDGFFTVPLYVRAATHMHAVRVIPGLTGGLATLSVIGRTLLSMLPDPDLQRFLERAAYWAKRARVATPHDPEQILRAVEQVRVNGYLCSHNLLLPGVGAVAVPLPVSESGERLAIVVCGASDRIEKRQGLIVSTLLREVQGFGQAPAGTLAPRAVARKATAPTPPALTPPPHTPAPLAPAALAL